jgi:hypothetical protein
MVKLLQKILNKQIGKLVKFLMKKVTSKYPVDSTWEASKVVPVYQGIDQAKLTPILTKALQEVIARIEQLEARITTLENK